MMLYELIDLYGVFRGSETKYVCINAINSVFEIGKNTADLIKAASGVDRTSEGEREDEERLVSF